MIKRSPGITRPNDRKGYWGGQTFPNFLSTIMKYGGLDEIYHSMPEVDQTTLRLAFTVGAGDSVSRSLPANSDNWMLLSTTIDVASAGAPIGLVTLTSLQIKPDGSPGDTVLEEAPIDLTSGVGTWPRMLFPEQGKSINRRVFSVSNYSITPILATIGFHFMRVNNNISG